MVPEAMGSNIGTWSWMGDPQPGEPGFVSRALVAERQPRLQYGRTTWTLVHDAATTDVPDQTAAGYHLRLDAYFSTLVGVVGAVPHIAQETRLKRAVEPLFVAVEDSAETEASVGALLDAAGVAIESVLG